MSEQHEEKRGRKPSISVTPRADIVAQDVDSIAAQINERRLRGERIEQGEIPMLEPGKWALRWANSLAEENRHYTIVHEQGWVPVTVNDLAPGTSPESIGCKVSESGALCKGIRGDEVLYRKDKKLHDAIKMRETHDRLKAQRSESAAKHDVANAVAGVHGSEAADYIAKNTTVRIQDQQGPL